MATRIIVDEVPSLDHRSDAFKLGIADGLWPREPAPLAHLGDDHPAHHQWQILVDGIREEVGPEVARLFNAAMTRRLPWTWEESPVMATTLADSLADMRQQPGITPLTEAKEALRNLVAQLRPADDARPSELDALDRESDHLTDVAFSAAIRELTAFDTSTLW